MVNEPYRYRCPFPWCRSTQIKRRTTWFAPAQYYETSDYPYYCETCGEGVFAKFDMKTGKAVVQ